MVMFSWYLAIPDLYRSFMFHLLPSSALNFFTYGMLTVFVFDSYLKTFGLYLLGFNEFFLIVTLFLDLGIFFLI
jgi:hypothetical protein